MRLARAWAGVMFADCTGTEAGEGEDGVLAERRAVEDGARDLCVAGFGAASRGASTVTGGSAAGEPLWPKAMLKGTKSDNCTAATLTPHKARYPDIANFLTPALRPATNKRSPERQADTGSEG